MRSAAAGGDSRPAALSRADRFRMAPPSTYDSLTSEQIARIKLRYETGQGTVADIAAAEQFEIWQIHNMRAKFGWASRRATQRAAVTRSVEHEKAIAAAQEERRAERASAAQAAAASEPTASFDARALVESTTAVLEREIAALQEREPGATKATDLAALARAIALLRDSYGKPGKHDKTGHADDEPRLDLAELRRELARKIDALCAEGEDPASAGQADPAGDCGEP